MRKRLTASKRMLSQRSSTNVSTYPVYEYWHTAVETTAQHYGFCIDSLPYPSKKRLDKATPRLQSCCISSPFLTFWLYDQAALETQNELYEANSSKFMHFDRK
ncbi:hypothetical protein KIN20_014076 [Parelaphostrongylus tenuis]|uniref:Uncharacterized protein n=1 Tax=Parelaphostrongylus tenuis TaxID=148309 RepID=A0AAD5MD25_PARTN|nr:hypothetical protein KIN20_014076 [Parelaphostrongylus tenuis]